MVFLVSLFRQLHWGGIEKIPTVIIEYIILNMNYALGHEHVSRITLKRWIPSAQPVLLLLYAN